MIRPWLFWLVIWLCFLLTVLALPPVLAAARPLWVPLALAYFALRDPEQPLFLGAFFSSLLVDAQFNLPFGSHALAWVPMLYIMMRLRSLWLLMPSWQSTPLIGALWLLITFILFWLDGAMGRPTDIALRWLPAVATMVCWPLWVWLLDWLLPRHNPEE